MRLRAIQLLVRYGAIGMVYLTTRLGMTATEADLSSLIEPIATGTVALACLFVDHWIHRMSERVLPT